MTTQTKEPAIRPLQPNEAILIAEGNSFRPDENNNSCRLGKFIVHSTGDDSNALDAELKERQHMAYVSTFTGAINISPGDTLVVRVDKEGEFTILQHGGPPV